MKGIIKGLRNLGLFREGAVQRDLARFLFLVCGKELRRRACASARYRVMMRTRFS
jgi:hypothetical protein